MQNHLTTGSIFPFWEPQNTNYRGDSYRYGFNGKENDNEVQGAGNQQDYGFRIYDPRLGKFISADPLIVQGRHYPELSPYQFASNRPIDGIDLDGLEYKDVNGNNVATDPLLPLSNQDLIFLNIYINANLIPAGTVNQLYGGALVPMVPAAPNSNVSTAQQAFNNKYRITPGSNANLDSPFSSSGYQNGTSETNIANVVDGQTAMSPALHNYFITNAIQTGANAAVTPMIGDNSVANATSVLTAQQIATAQANMAATRMDNAFFSFFNPNRAVDGPDAFNCRNSDYEAQGSARGGLGGLLLIKIHPSSSDTYKIPMLFPNP